MHRTDLRRARRRVLAAAPLTLALAAGAAAQVHQPPSLSVDQRYDSGPVENRLDREAVVISFTVHHGGARWLRLYFEEVELAGDLLAGTAARLRLTGHRDGAVQELDPRHLAQWQSSSAYFNGDAVQVEVVAPAHTGPSRVRMRALDAGLPELDPTICGPTDDRVLSSDVRAGRLLPVGCTGWLIDDCQHCLLTAGHCTGSLQVVEFNVPLSNSDGSLNHPSPDDQYAVDPTSLQTNGGQGVGDDWGYFGCFPNPNTGMTPFGAQGATFVLASPPATPAGNTIRITGYGTDNTPSTHNQVQQTHTGPMVVSNPAGSVGYQTDTTGGNSGSPVVWEDMGTAVGIHTHGGCDAGGGGNNWGTGSQHAGLQAALADPRGVCAAGILALDPPAVIAPNSPTTVSATVAGTPVPGSVLLHHRYDGGVYQSVVMTDLGGGLYAADLPPAACDDDPEFYFSVMDPACGLVTDPPGAPGVVYHAQVGKLVVTFADDFESDLGWTAFNLGATSGDWQRGVPVDDAGWAYDPPADSDGSGSCYLTQNQVGNTDVDNGAVQLVSPVFDLSAGGVVSYDYYLNLTNADGSDRLLVEADDNGGAGAWVEVARHDTSGGLSWRSHVITDADLLAAGLTLGNQMVLRFTANDADPQTIVEAGLDAFLVARLECDPTSVGQNYCVPQVSNSSGLPGHIRGNGSTDVTQNDVTLTAEDLPTNKFGYFLTSQTQDKVQPPGAVGFLCLGGNIGRYSKNIMNSGAGGSFALKIDLTQMPVQPPVAVQPGESWNFQAWFRDVIPPIDVSNFTDGLEIDFQ